MIREALLLVSSLALTSIASAQPPAARAPQPAKAMLILEDQFERKQDLSEYRGGIVVLLFGDKEGMPANRSLGEKLHVQFHPTAKGMTPGEAHKQPVQAVPGIPANIRSPEVYVIPVACIGKVPDLVKGIIKRQVKKEAPEVPVWLDFEDKMKSTFGMKEGIPNLMIIDADGKVRVKISGELDENNYAKVVRGIELLRKEAVTAK